MNNLIFSLQGCSAFLECEQAYYFPISYLRHFVILLSIFPTKLGNLDQWLNIHAVNLTFFILQSLENASIIDILHFVIPTSIGNMHILVVCFLFFRKSSNRTIRRFEWCYIPTKLVQASIVYSTRFSDFPRSDAEQYISWRIRRNKMYQRTLQKGQNEQNIVKSECLIYIDLHFSNFQIMNKTISYFMILRKLFK